MARIAGINLPLEKRIEIALTYVYGISHHRSREILRLAKVTLDTRVKALTTDEVDRIRGVIEKNFKVEGDLRADVSQNIKRLKEISSYRGVRHSRNLPLRGQRTKTNARTKRGKKKTVGSGRRALDKK
ncbi:30S ribosomal protein S13 [Candidatus Berkelbacteria bacterium]|nr:30S ribosomal protein S13 [Candidatus Berkelbacteria bacterium]